MNYKLRPWSQDDLENLVALADNYNIARFMADEFPHPYTVENGKGFIAMAASHDPLRIFAIEVEGKAAGGIGIHPQSGISRKNAELGYWIGEPYWGKGIITNAVVEMVDYGFKNFEIDRIFARPFSNNPASQRVLEKAGFSLEATLKGTFFKFGEKLDELIYSVRRS